MTTAEALDITIEEAENTPEEEIYAAYPHDSLWVPDGKNGERVNETNFARLFRDINLVKFHNGTFYTKEGVKSREQIASDIWGSLAEAGLNRSTKSTVENMLAACAYAATVPKFTVDENVIPFANGNYYVRERLFRYGEITTVPYRLRVAFSPVVPDTPYFDKWLNDLLEPDDQRTLQEYLGYCMVPVTSCQKALFLVGEGGAGKSGLGVILEALLGSAEINVSNTQEFIGNKFMLAELEHKLVLYDDDLDSAALSETGLYKKLITNTIPITADKKYGPTYKFTPKIKLISCCNRMLTSIYDKSGGFYRRLLPLIVKPIRRDFVPDLRFYEKLKQEAEGIALWALAGLIRLMENDWVLSESQRTRDYMESKQNIENPLPLFMEAAFDFGPEAPGVSTRQIISLYNEWCIKNAYKPQSNRSVQTWLSENAERYGIKQDTNIKEGDKRVRGYRGLIVKEKSDGKIQLV